MQNTAPTSILLAGATGLVGQNVLRLALADARVSRVVAPTRRPLTPHPKLLNPVLDFDQPLPEADWWQVDAVICALGTTMAQAGSQAAFRKVDLELPLAIAQRCQAHGAKAYALNSALGANARSMVFYSRTKGQVEQGLRALHFRSLTLARPGLIGGQRNESRPGESLSIRLTTWLTPVLPRRLRIVPAERIAQHLLDAAVAAKPGVLELPSEALL